MKRTAFVGGVSCALAVILSGQERLRADEVPAEYRAAIQKGLDWVAKSQSRDEIFPVTTGESSRRSGNL